MNYKINSIPVNGGTADIVTLQLNEDNSLTGKNMKELDAILAEHMKDDSKKGIILASENPKFFCNGLSASNVLAAPKEEFNNEVGGIVLLFSSLIRFSKPLIAEVSGHAMGGGAVITVSSDFKYMLDSKGRIGFTEVLVGLPLPQSFIEKIKMTVAPRYWNEVCLEGTVYKGNEAKEIGLIDATYSTVEDLRKYSVKKIESLSKIPMSAFSGTKEMLNKNLIENLPKYEKEILESFQQPIIQSNLKEAMTALVEKRRPNLK